MTDTLLSFSSGFDSTAVAYDYLKRNPDKTLLLHHIKLKNWEGRLDYEYAAVQKILRWFKANGLNNYEYLESSFDYGTIRAIIKDYKVWSFFQGTILFHRKNINYVLMGSHAASHFGQPETEGEKARIRMVHYVANRKNIEFIYPLIKNTKADTLRMMPKELRDLCWYCRKPKNGRVCGTCATCKTVNIAYEQLRGKA